MTSNGSGPITWQQFVAYMTDFEERLTKKYATSGECLIRHQDIDDEMERIDKKLAWYERTVIGALITALLSLASVLIGKW